MIKKINANYNQSHDFIFWQNLLNKNIRLETNNKIIIKGKLINHTKEKIKIKFSDYQETWFDKSLLSSVNYKSYSIY